MNREGEGEKERGRERGREREREREKEREKERGNIVKQKGERSDDAKLVDVES